MQIQTEAEAEVVGQAQAQVKVGEETGCHLAPPGVLRPSCGFLRLPMWGRPGAHVWRAAQ